MGAILNLHIGFVELLRLKIYF